MIFFYFYENSKFLNNLVDVENRKFIESIYFEQKKVQLPFFPDSIFSKTVFL